ncbi:hypothetical protein ABVT39_003564 [Epinephelus coioides]
MAAIFKTELQAALTENLSNIKTELQAVKSELSGSITNIRSDVRALKDTVSEMETSLSTCTDDITTLQVEVEHLSADLIRLDNKCEDLEARSQHNNVRHNVLTNSDAILRNSNTDETRLPVREAATFKKKSCFVPHSNLNPSMITYSNLVENDLSQICKKADHKMNLSNVELKCLNELEQRKDIVIRSSDKGGSTVVMSFDQYNNSIMSQLTDKSC